MDGSHEVLPVASKHSPRITLSIETAEVRGGSFSDNLVLLDFLKACRGFPDLCSPSPWNGVVNL